MKGKIRYALIILFAASMMFAGEWSQTFLPLRQTGVEEFLNKYPEYDSIQVLIRELKDLPEHQPEKSR